MFQASVSEPSLWQPGLDHFDSNIAETCRTTKRGCVTLFDEGNAAVKDTREQALKGGPVGAEKRAIFQRDRLIGVLQRHGPGVLKTLA